MWRRAKLNNINGLFEVTKGSTNFAVSTWPTSSLIRGKTGWILVDPLTTAPTARSALAFAREQLGDQKISAIIFTRQPHQTHFGGIDGVLSDAERAHLRGDRARELHGRSLQQEHPRRSDHAAPRPVHVRQPVCRARPPGTWTPAWRKQQAFGGDIGILDPPRSSAGPTSASMSTAWQDGLRYTPASKAPAEMTFYIPQYKAFCGAEVVSTCTTSTPCAAPGYATRWRVATSTSHHPVRPGRRGVFPAATTGRYGARNASTASSRASATPTSSSMTRPCAWPTPATRRRKSPPNSSCPPRWRELCNPRLLRHRQHNAKAVYQAYFGWYDGNPGQPQSTAARRSRRRLRRSHRRRRQGTGHCPAVIR
ncbi:MAG: MBL fold metallo-hydrolase [Haliea sp.]|nr:MBL fold metallo-hydrolase [Haliea sp.]